MVHVSQVHHGPAGWPTIHLFLLGGTGGAKLGGGPGWRPCGGGGGEENQKHQEHRGRGHHGGGGDSSAVVQGGRKLLVGAVEKDLLV